MIYGIVGYPGSAKTYYASWLALQDIKKGVKVYANYWIEGAELFHDLEKVLMKVYMQVKWERKVWLDAGNPRWKFKPTPVTIVIDEINLVCPSRYWYTFNIQLIYFFCQSRKMGLNFYWTSQHQNRVEKVVREITNYIIVCRFFLGEKIPIRIARTFDSTAVDIDGPKKSLNTKLFKINEKIYKLYDTYDMIAIPDKLQKYIPKESDKGFNFD